VAFAGMGIVLDTQIFKQADCFDCVFLHTLFGGYTDSLNGERHV
jgi:hypothetical protein